MVMLKSLTFSQVFMEQHLNVCSLSEEIWGIRKWLKPFLLKVSEIQKTRKINCVCCFLWGFFSVSCFYPASDWSRLILSVQVYFLINVKHSILIIQEVDFFEKIFVHFLLNSCSQVWGLLVISRLIVLKKTVKGHFGGNFTIQSSFPSTLSFWCRFLLA